MDLVSFKKWNTILGWVVFGIAIVTYSLTVEPTISFWDCSEYIATSSNLELGHPPGAPLFQMIGAFFSVFTTNPTQIALMVNMMSAFSSAFTVLFMFWSLTMLMKRVFLNEEASKQNYIMVLGSAFIASLAFTFSDTFWYSAVEAEVYAMAMLFVSLLFWLGLRWEQDINTPRGNKWFLAIAFVAGLSFGVHLMALLTIPSIILLYLFKTSENVTLKKGFIFSIISVLILLFIFGILVPFVLEFFGRTEIFAVNSLGLPFNSGEILALALVSVAFYFGLTYTKKKGFVKANTIVLAMLFVLLGFSNWLMLPIRANANPPINENKPSDAAAILAYYNREQYGDQSLLYGPLFSDSYSGLDKNNPYKDGKPIYERDDASGKYIITNNYKNARQNTDNNHKGLLPRMWSNDHNVNYMTYTGPLDFRISPEFAEEHELVDLVAQFRTAFNQGKFDLEDYDTFLKTYGEYLIVEKPSFFSNIKFMLEYQFGSMYWRYLMWNFVGRQNDIQWQGNALNGNWISGIKPVDKFFLGISQDNLTPDMLNNKARNTYYFLPFILALIGIAFHAKRDLKSFYILMVLFLFTGLALKVYLNERPFEPRERDYALVASFYVFAMWIAFGVYSIYEGIKKYIQPKVAVPVVLGVSMLAAPVLMAKENWNDHDRSNKYTALTTAKAYLDSCEENAILFTIGDNDTFPLWYLQEIERYRTDVRIVNTQLIATDWYIDQMKRKAWKSDPVPISFKHEQYRGSNRDACVLYERRNDSISLNELITFLSSEDERTKIQLRNEQWLNFYPTNKIFIPIDKETIIKNKVVAPKYYDSIVPAIQLTIDDAIYKNRLMMLDIVNQNNWKRPIYFTGGSFGEDDYIWMKDYLELDGMCFKLVPIKTTVKEPDPQKMGFINTDKTYNIVKKWKWGNGESPTIYHDPETRKNSISFRMNLARLMEALIKEGKNNKAEEIINLAMQKMPIEYYGYYTLINPFVEGYYQLGKKEKARKTIAFLIAKYQDDLKYFHGFSENNTFDYRYEIVSTIIRYKAVVEIAKDAKDIEFYEKEKNIFNSYNKMFEEFGRDDLQ
ncbi:DUF2723 domain-containing protein [Flavobacterium sp.]|uniref:glycosyltransferase family 117 protein n=1 Tax=Flavobacterium sp. TaxID=239 RepID=UPI003526FCB5